LAAVILDSSGVEIEDGFFSKFVKPTKPIPPFIMELASITNDDVSTAESFAVVGDAFIGFIQQHANELGAGMVDHIILVGHNGKALDIPFFIHQLGVHGIERRFIEDGGFAFGMDTLQIARRRSMTHMTSAQKMVCIIIEILIIVHRKIS
jgi:DNA polymerase III epsilon subunit-like protein